MKLQAAFMRDRLVTAAGLAARGFFVPYPYAGSVERGIEIYAALKERFDTQRDVFADRIGHVAPVAQPFGAFLSQGGIDHAMFSYRDAALAYAMIRSERPKRILEIGSGSSTRTMARAVADEGFDCAITCIDPVPRRTLGDLPVEHLQRVLDTGDEALASALEPGDVLFIDSSHVMLPGMDVDIEFNLMFPRLKPGVIVHVHDIFLPFAYPSYWGRREYSEQNALMGWLFGDMFEVLVPNHYVSRAMPEAWREAIAVTPQLEAFPAGSIWLRRR